MNGSGVWPRKLLGTIGSVGQLRMQAAGPRLLTSPDRIVAMGRARLRTRMTGTGRGWPPEIARYYRPGRAAEDINRDPENENRDEYRRRMHAYQYPTSSRKYPDIYLQERIAGGETYRHRRCESPPRRR